MPSISRREQTSPSSRRDPTFTCATVCSGPVDATYRRAGRGDAVVVLAAPDWSGGPAIFAALAQEFRLIVPEVPLSSATSPDHLAFGDWLAAFLDGLGLDAVSLVADERFGAVALGSALLEPGRVHRLAIVLDGRSSAASDAEIAETLRRTRTRIFVRWLGTDHDAAAREVTRSLTARRSAD